MEDPSTAPHALDENGYDCSGRGLAVLAGGFPRGRAGSESAGGGGILDEDGDASDWIEIHNTSAEAVSLAGWYLTDDKDQLQKFTLPNGTTIGAGKYLRLGAAQLGFELGGTQGTNLWLIEASANGHPVRFVDHVTFDAPDVEVALGRWPNGDPAAALFPMTSPSPGRPTSWGRSSPACSTRTWRTCPMCRPE